MNFHMAPAFASLISLLFGKKQSAASAGKAGEIHWEVLLPKTSLGQVKSPSEGISLDRRVLLALGDWHKQEFLTFIHFSLEKFLLLVFPSHVKEDILIHFNGFVSLFLNKNMNEDPL